VGEVVCLFLKLGTIAFRGPAARIAMMDDEVVRKRGRLTQDRRGSARLKCQATDSHGFANSAWWAIVGACETRWESPGALPVPICPLPVYLTHPWRRLCLRILRDPSASRGAAPRER